MLLRLRIVNREQNTKLIITKVLSIIWEKGFVNKENGEVDVNTYERSMDQQILKENEAKKIGLNMNKEYDVIELEMAMNM